MKMVSEYRLECKRENLPAKQSWAEIRKEAQRPLAAEMDLRVAFTVLTSEDGSVLTKTFALEKGEPRPIRSAGIPSRSRAERIELHGSTGEIMKGLANTLFMLGSSQVLILAPPPDGRPECKVVPQRDLRDNPGAVAKTQEYFKNRPDAPALIGLDFDTKAWPADIVGKVRNTPEELTGVLRDVCPAFGTAAFVRRASTSAGITAINSGWTTGGNSGQHRYYVVRDADDINDFGRRLADHLILAGFGYPMIAATGAIFVRTLIDEAATQDNSRLWYEADAIVGAGLKKDASARKPDVCNATGGTLDTRSLPELTQLEAERLETIKMEIRVSAEAEAAPIRAAYREKRKRELMRKGTQPEVADKIVGDAVERHDLAGSFEIELDNGSLVSVDEILDEPSRYHRVTCADPLEPEYGGGRNKAIIYTDKNSPIIFSHAHGGIQYTLSRAPEHWFETPAADDQESAGAAPARVIGWPEPLDLFGDADPGDLSTPPAHCLPPAIVDWVRSEARRKGVSEAFAASAAIGALGGAIGNSLRIQPRRYDTAWTEPAALWVTLVADPGRVKSPTIKAAVAPLIKLDGERYAEDKPRHDQWEAARKARTKKPTAPDPGPEPTIRRTVVDDITIEQQIRIHAANPRGLLRLPDELAGYLDSFGQYKSKGGGDRSQMLRLFDGDAVMVDRVGAGSIRAESALMGIVAGTQPEKIAQQTKSLGSDGMLQRFIFICDDGRKRKGLDEPPNEVAGARYARLIRGLATAQYCFPMPLRMNDPAQEAFADAADTIADMKGIVGMPAAWRGHIEKWGKFLPRLVLIFHCARTWNDETGVSPVEPIDVATVESASAFARFLLRHAMHFYREYFDPDPADAEARGFAGYLLTHPDTSQVTPYTIAESKKQLRGSDRDRVALRMRIASELETAGWLRVEKSGAEGPKSWTVNPLIHQRYADRALWEKRERKSKQESIIAAGRARKWVSADKLSDLSEGNSPER